MILSKRRFKSRHLDRYRFRLWHILLSNIFIKVVPSQEDRRSCKHLFRCCRSGRYGSVGCWKLLCLDFKSSWFAVSSHISDACTTFASFLANHFMTIFDFMLKTGKSCCFGKFSIMIALQLSRFGCSFLPCKFGFRTSIIIFLCLCNSRPDIRETELIFNQ